MTYFAIPHYRLDTKAGVGELLADAVYATTITGHSIDARYFALSPDGTLTVREGYRWDFGSGPAIDTPVMVSASCAHDALYQAIREGYLGTGRRRAADETFRSILKRGGVGWLRRNYCYWAVRIFGGAHIIIQ